MQAAAKELDRMIGERETNTGPQINELSIAFTRKPQNAWWLTNMIPETAGQDDHLPDMYSMTVLFIEPDAYQGVCDPQTGHPGLAAINPNVPTTPDKLGKVYQNMLWAWLVYNNRTQYEAGLVTEALSSVTFEITGLDKTLSHAAVETQQGRYMPNPQMWRQAIKSFIEVHSASRLRRNVIARVMEFPRWVDNAFSSGQNGPVGQVGKFVTNDRLILPDQGLHVDGGQYDMVTQFNTTIKVYRRES
ncbi:putative virion structural protein [Salmonella phage SPFM8]|nr:putative virion structural protein [Salmonella phage SPFM8]